MYINNRIYAFAVDTNVCNIIVLFAKKVNRRNIKI